MHPLEKFTDHIYIVNLDRRPERWEDCKEELRDIGISPSSKNVERFSAVDGYEHPVVDELELVDAYGNPDKVPGNLGCILSHLQIYEDADDRGFEAITIFEDDVVFANDFNERFKKYSKQLPEDWQFVYFGGNNNEEPRNFKENVKVCKTTWTTHSYMVKPSHRNEIIKRVYESEFEAPIDNIYGGIQKEMDFYIFDPRIAIQREGHSDIVGEFRNYDHVLNETGVDFR